MSYKMIKLETPQLQQIGFGVRCRLCTLFVLLCCISAHAQSPYIAAVDEYVPAPGQFINTLPEWQEGDTAAEMVGRCTEALANNAQGMVCLGSWGGYITFHFDHPVVNLLGERDIYVQGNCQDTLSNSEPGIIMVSQDLNGNHLPDDVWYEISGSADVDSLGLVLYDYVVTYVNPNTTVSASTTTAQEASEATDLLPVTWSDNLGNEGIIERNAFHNQEYFPLWIDSPLTLHGTRLPDNGWNLGSDKRQYWVHTPLRYGYADNLANQDTLSCAFDISWAVDPVSREPARLQYVDFVRIYSGCLQICGWLGETSTEISGAKDLHPLAAVSDNALSTIHTSSETSAAYDLWGRRCVPTGKGLQFVVRGSTKTVVNLQW